MADIEIIKLELNKARKGVDLATTATREWGDAAVEGVAHTTAQRNALIATFDSNIADAETAIAAAKAERNS